jgi:hypothetical protein
MFTASLVDKVLDIESYLTLEDALLDMMMATSWPSSATLPTRMSPTTRSWSFTSWPRTHSLPIVATSSVIATKQGRSPLELPALAGHRLTTPRGTDAPSPFFGDQPWQ